MAPPQMEGTPSELAPYLAQHANQRFRLIALTSEGDTTAEPNEDVLTMLRDISQMKAGMSATDAAETDRLLREARAGAMYSDARDA